MLPGSNRTKEISVYFSRWEQRSRVTKAIVLTAGFSYAFAGERTFSSTWRGRQRNTRGPEAVERGGHLWKPGATRHWTWGRIGGTTSTAGTAPATASTSAGPRKSTARLVSPSHSSPFRYRCIFCTRSTATSLRSYSPSPPPNRPRTSDPKIHRGQSVIWINRNANAFALVSFFRRKLRKVINVINKHVGSRTIEAGQMVSVSFDGKKMLEEINEDILQHLLMHVLKILTWRNRY